MTQTKAELLQTRHQGDIRLGDADSTNYVGLKAPATDGSNLVWTLPATDGSANQFLQTNASGVLGWGSADVSSAMPLSGGTFTGDVTFDGETAGRDIVFDRSSNSLEFADNAKAQFGAALDLEIYHDASNSYIKEAGTGNLFIQADNLVLENAAGANYLAGISGGSVYLYHNDSTRITTTAAGVEIGGDLSTASGSSFTIHAGGASGTAANFLARCGSENAIVANANSSVDLYHNNVKTLSTQANGITVLGPEGGSAQVNLYSDEGDDNADLWRIDNKNNGTIAIETYAGGSWAAALSLDNSFKATLTGAIYGPVKTVSALELDLSSGNYFIKTISGNSTFTFANPAASGTVTAFTLELTHSSGTVTWPSEVKWNADTAPTLTTGKTHLFMFVTDDGGSRYRGSALVDYVN